MMNYLPFCGYWFYGGANGSQRAAFFCSWGLLESAPGAVTNVVSLMINMNQFLAGTMPL